eukprot:696709-Rhodomonas_salina.1
MTHDEEEPQIMPWLRYDDRDIMHARSEQGACDRRWKRHEEGHHTSFLRPTARPAGHAHAFTQSTEHNRGVSVTAD